MTAVAAAAAPAGATAAASATPPSLDFGSVPVGTTSAPQAVTLTETCTAFDSVVTHTCLTSVTDVYNLTIGTGTVDFAALPNSGSPCGSSLSPTSTQSVSCVVDVTFTPSATGTRTGTLSTGTVVLPPGPGPTVSLSGTGTTSDPGGGGAGSPSTGGAPSSAGANPTVTAPTVGKKCKKAKRRSAQVARKRCETKRR